MKKKTLLSWSSGKDAAWALYKLQKDPDVEVAGLFCTVNKTANRVAMHNSRVELLKRQAESIGLPMELIEIPNPCSDAEYGRIMGQFVEKAKAEKIDCFAFGDLFLEDIRTYREEKMKDTGIKILFPLWNIPTGELANEMIQNGLKAITVSIDPKQIPPEFIAKEFDQEFLDSLPESIDPCGENGEFHTFVFDGPMFKEKIEIVEGEVFHRDGFTFADILPKRETE